AAALTWRAQVHRKKADDARGGEKTARDEAREYRRQAVDAGMVQSQAETEAKGLAQRLASVESKQKQLVREDLLGSEESPDVGVTRWTTKATDHKAAVERLDGEIERLDQTLEAFDGALATAGGVLSERQSQHQTLQDHFERATGERQTIE